MTVLGKYSICLKIPNSKLSELVNEKYQSERKSWGLRPKIKTQNLEGLFGPPKDGIPLIKGVVFSGIIGHEVGATTFFAT